ncbi:MAG: ABC transporter ATP-binding protein [Deltaproteobacteria bacterium]|nr:ABC transporter ATP-binding protein [Deltaproteobacteria bacterium]
MKKTKFKSKEKKKNLHRIMPLLKIHKMRFFFAILCMLLIAGTSAALAWIVKPVLDDVFIKKDIDKLYLISTSLITIFFIKGAAAFMHVYLMTYIGQHIVKALRDKLYNAIMDLPISFFHKETTGALMSRITYDVNIVKDMLSTAVTNIGRDFFTIVCLTILILYQDWKMALIAIIVLPIAFFPVFILGRWVRKISSMVQNAMGKLNIFLHETFAGNKIIKAFGTEEFEKKRFIKKSDELLKMEMKAVVPDKGGSAIIEFFTGFGIAAVIFYGGLRVIQNEMTPGTFFSFITAVGLLYDPIRRTAPLNSVIQRGLAAIERIFDIIEKKSDIKEAENPVFIKNKINDIIFKDISFGYSDKEFVLRNIEVKVKAGEKLALAGTSGGGKTSFVNLIPRFYDATEGSLLIDGINVKDVSLKSLRKNIAIVTQEPILFNDTIKNNISYGKTNASDQDIEDAAKAAFAFDFIKEFPQGFDTNIGELGGRLSGGEKQRICIARALLKNAPILILDEATSSLDANAEMLVQEALENLMKGRTAFIIAHRLSTIRYADRILVFEKGKIIEQGNHDQLIRKQGTYYKLYKMQTKGSEKKIKLIIT